MFVADYLTTPGQAAKDDWQMIEDAGFTLESADGSPLPVLSSLQENR
ncbi:hypothetical protein [Tritonibacter sp. SIMBA_163]